ncbi:hypothetical protein [Thermococcus sp. JdF3]|uniref:hypothetical protein n=1 Tax=Thermococcus sp. JdF3 TaxID=1638258 RepID=UPI00143C40EF|nr:hypothetical protein [Thermococcus sp. JdF3]NJE00389.1 hypothetical protein [Thermococcus sp. JdF3]
MGKKALSSVSIFSFLFNTLLGESNLSPDPLVPMFVYWLYLFGAGEKPRVGILVRDFAIIILAGTAGWIIGARV